jgi:hypothetical protein
LQWIFFGGDGEIKENDRDQQRKIVKYSHLMANEPLDFNSEKEFIFEVKSNAQSKPSTQRESALLH